MKFAEHWIRQLHCAWNATCASAVSTANPAPRLNMCPSVNTTHWNNFEKRSPSTNKDMKLECVAQWRGVLITVLSSTLCFFGMKTSHNWFRQQSKAIDATYALGKGSLYRRMRHSHAARLGGLVTDPATLQLFLLQMRNGRHMQNLFLPFVSSSLLQEPQWGPGLHLFNPSFILCSQETNFVSQNKHLKRFQNCPRLQCKSETKRSDSCPNCAWSVLPSKKAVFREKNTHGALADIALLLRGFQTGRTSPLRARSQFSTWWIIKSLEILDSIIDQANSAHCYTKPPTNSNNQGKSPLLPKAKWVHWSLPFDSCHNCSLADNSSIILMVYALWPLILAFVWTRKPKTSEN